MIHFSVDDTINIFENLSKEKYSSCFEEPTLLFFKELNKKYGLKVTLYCFYKAESGFALCDATSAFKDEFKENSNWLRFGFHAYDSKTKYSDYDAKKFISEAKNVYDNLYRIVSPDAVVYDVRLGFATGSRECIKAFKEEYPLFRTLYGVDDERIEYYLLPEENDILLSKGLYSDDKIGIDIKLSELRLECQTDMTAYLKNIQKRDCYAFFTHEVHLGSEKVRARITEMCEFAKGFTF